jgi:antibiotic biosynthesis monooxygenase (ABM) superfamily enzyme
MTRAGQTAHDDAMTVVVHRRVKDGREGEFQQAMQEFTRFAMAFPGHRGLQLLRSAQGGRDYTVVDRFASTEARRAFTATPEYAAWMRELGELTEGDPRIDELTGLEGWFAGDAPALPNPGKVKMAVATFLGVFPVSTLVGLAVAPQLVSLPLLVRNAIASAIIVSLLTWVVMPFITRLLHAWLFPEAKPTGPGASGR